MVTLKEKKRKVWLMLNDFVRENTYVISLPYSKGVFPDKISHRRMPKL